MTEPSGVPRVVIAVITSELGILTARCCQLPGWAFLAGEAEPGASPREAASRCVFDATGLAVTSTWLIDRQARPDCVLDHVHVTVGVPEPREAESEGCARFWWMNAVGVSRVMPGLLAPVRFYLRELEARGLVPESLPGDCGRIGGSNLPLWYRWLMAPLRALALERLSKNPDPASTSFERQHEINTAFIQSKGWELIGTARDSAVSAFRVPPEKRPKIRAWLARPDDFDVIVYWRQDRLVRRVVDFMGMVAWCREHGKKLYSATEGTGDVTEHGALIIGFVQAWLGEGESLSGSARRTSSMGKLAEQGRYGGGRVPYFARAVRRTDGPGWEEVADMRPGQGGRVVRQAALRVIAGQSVNSVIDGWNRRGQKSCDGKQWYGQQLRDMLRNPKLLTLGVVDADEWAGLQLALKTRALNRTVRTTGEESSLLDVVFCRRCGGKIYKAGRGRTGSRPARCRYSLHRSEVPAGKICSLPGLRYEVLEAMVNVEMSLHKDELILEPVTQGSIRIRLDDIAKELNGLMPEFTARLIDRAEFQRRQDELMDEAEQLEKAGKVQRWKETNQTVGQKWESLSPAERRLWLIQIGTKFYLDYTGEAGWQLEGEWESEFEAGRLKIAQAKI